MGLEKFMDRLGGCCSSVFDISEEIDGERLPLKVGENGEFGLSRILFNDGLRWYVLKSYGSLWKESASESSPLSMRTDRILG